jgi:glutathione synthase/RimK-type ligase-like ATP-grasp enzyme
VIVAVTHAGDDHGPPVLEALRRLGEDAVVLDTGELPGRATLSAVLDPRGAEAGIRGSHGLVRAADVTAVWWRRPRPLEPSPGLRRDDADFAIRQTEAALSGLAAALETRWVNDPWRDSAASHKLHQLALARRAGLAVPSTLVTNDPEQARLFLAAAGRGRVVHKALHATPEDWRTTRFVGRAELRRLSSIRLAPVILQAYVPGVDVRVTAVGGALFATAIDARRTGSPEDFRPVFDDARVAPCHLPAPVARRLRRLLGALGLSYAAMDLRRRADGEHVFLEVNPSGQWLFVERRTGLAITQAVAALLAGRAPAARSAAARVRRLRTRTVRDEAVG